MFAVIAIRPSSKGTGIVFETAPVPVAGSKFGRVQKAYAFAEVLERGSALQALVATLKVSDFEIKDVVDGLGELVEL